MLVSDVQSFGDYVVHSGTLMRGHVAVGDEVIGRIDPVCYYQFNFLIGIACCLCFCVCLGK